jgi:hypothetical protein
MGEKQHELSHLKGQNPFRVPDGYMEGLTDQIMRQLPEKTTRLKNSERTTLITRIRPWVAAAAAIAGIGFFINVFIGLDKQSSLSSTDSQKQIPAMAISKAEAAIDEEYLEYLETRYSNYILEEELADSE